MFASQSLNSCSDQATRPIASNPNIEPTARAANTDEAGQEDRARSAISGKHRRHRHQRARHAAPQPTAAVERTKGRASELRIRRR